MSLSVSLSLCLSVSVSLSLSVSPYLSLALYVSLCSLLSHFALYPSIPLTFKVVLLAPTSRRQIRRVRPCRRRATQQRQRCFRSAHDHGSVLHDIGAGAVIVVCEKTDLTGHLHVRPTREGVAVTEACRTALAPLPLAPVLEEATGVVPRHTIHTGVLGIVVWAGEEEGLGKGGGGG